MISVIIPVYNSSEFLEDAINSVLSQDVCYEIILVDDGSTDSSGQICDRYGAIYDNIIVIHQKNSGVTKARNAGFENSKGEYILFLDSDDMLYENALDSMLSHMHPDVDIVISEVREEGVITADEYIYYILNGYIPAGINGKLFRRRLFNENTLALSREINIGEDLIMNVKLALNATKCIREVSKSVYFYRVNSSSVIQTRKYDWNYEKKFIVELNKAFGNQRERYKDSILQSYYITIERLVIHKAKINWSDPILLEFVSWAKKHPMSLKQFIIINIRNSVIAKYLLALHRRIIVLCQL